VPDLPEPPPEAVRCFRLATKLLDAHQFEAAIEEYSSAIERAAGLYPDAFFRRAIARAALGHDDEALTDVAAAEHLLDGEKAKEGPYIRGWIAQNQGRFDEAEACYEEAIRRAPDWGAAHEKLSWLTATRTVTDDPTELMLGGDPTSIAARTSTVGAAGTGRQGRRSGAASASHSREVPTPSLDSLGQDLTAAARESKLSPIVSRADELAELEAVLCQPAPYPCSAMLVGPAGSGKTSIVEELARRIAAGEAAVPLRSRRVVALDLTALGARNRTVGALEEILRPVLAEAKRGNVIVFIDEVHRMVHLGGHHDDPADTLGQMLKEPLGRGELTCIGATTEEEFEVFIKSEAALARRFERVTVAPLDDQGALAALRAHADHLAERFGIELGRDVPEMLMTRARGVAPQQIEPERSLLLLRRLAGRLRTTGEPTPPTRERFDELLRVISGLPSDLPVRLNELRAGLVGRRGLSSEQAGQLMMMVDPEKSYRKIGTAGTRAVITMLGEAAPTARDMAKTIAAAFAKRSGPLVATVDLRPYEHLPALVEDQWESAAAPLRCLERGPVPVLLLENVDACGSALARAIGLGLASGFLIDNVGRRLNLAHALVILTATSFANLAELAAREPALAEATTLLLGEVARTKDRDDTPPPSPGYL
jgi:hypothetical protein